MDTVPAMTCPRVWEIPELISAIMSFLEVEVEDWGPIQDLKTLAVCARVSKRISEHALDALYGEGSSFTTILGLLCPMELDEDQYEYKQFTQPISAAHWTRFRHYSTRIRSLVLYPFNFKPYRISHESTMDLAFTSPRGEAFLPSLRELSWDFNLKSEFSPDWREGELRWILFLLHDGLRDLHLTLPSHEAEILMSYLPMRSPNLERLVLWVIDVKPWTSEPEEGPKDAAVRAIRGLPLLRTLEISEELVNPTLVNDIALRPEIRSNIPASQSLSP
ncbi:hypothetical protein SISSUDRAFT_733199 [Sistotremastrum suecicum HHB10207 ss-3]|uniref:F-box domain-containing protein n=1 Tax=Sistotremastrum suecicum HHB10207 ss-3 TaxID=1314776 RepID=A0A166DFF8_9AGAM|nr:hypothetical protein SISSUDRAFT_733199 [Sistotremastrum suecicum HHB10207 ss-3]